MKKTIGIAIISILFISCEIAVIETPYEVYSTGTYYTQTADVEFVVVYSDNSTDTIVETITNTNTPMQGIYYHDVEIDGIEFTNIEIDFEDYRLIGTWDDTFNNITFNDDGSYTSTSFGSGDWDTVRMEGIYLDSAGPYYYGFTYINPEEYLTLDTTVDLQKM